MWAQQVYFPGFPSNSKSKKKKNFKKQQLLVEAVFIWVVPSQKRPLVLLEIPEQYDTLFDFLNAGPWS